MLFNSLQFAIFLPIVFALYWLIPHKFRWALLLAASYYFYMGWNPKYLLLIIFTTAVSYFAALMIEKTEEVKKKKIVLTSAIVICLGVLFFFKYFNFASESVAKLLSLFTIQVNPVTLKVLLPVGISFYTFQTLSYVIDVYKGEVGAEKHFGKYATFISFFPQLVAGPIERTNNLLPQIKKEQKFDYEKATYGVKLMAWGFFKKMVIADNISMYISKAYENPGEYTGFFFVIAMLLFSIQIYCDFSGYSDIAIGTAKLMGIDIMTNFKSPYFSQSIKEFWSRWHISLSTWFRDYVYIPLGGNRVKKGRHFLNLLVTFIVSGLWHGANFTFIVWGAIHGLLQVIENILKISSKRLKGMKGIVKTIVVFALCTFAWVFFASKSLGDSLYIFRHMLDGISNPVAYIHEGFKNAAIPRVREIELLFSIALLFIYDFFSLKGDCIKMISKKNAVVRNLIYVSLLIIIILLRATQPAEFVYFQF